MQAAVILAGTAVAIPHAAGGTEPPYPKTLPELRAELQKRRVECGLPNQTALDAASETKADGEKEYQSWLAHDEVQAALANLWELEDRLGNQVIGLAIDHINEQMVLVVDPDLPTEDRAKIDSAAAGLDVPFQVATKSGCNSKRALDDVVQALTGDRNGRYAGLVYSFGVNTETAQVQISTQDPQLAAVLQKRFGNLVAIDDEAAAPTPLSGGRLSDASPHYGDARLDMGCTSNIPMVGGYGVRASMTAAHCGGNGTTFKSGGNLIGYGISANDTSADYVMIYHGSQTYNKTFYTDPGSPATRSVSGKVNVGVGSMVCAGGSYSLADCGAEVWQATSWNTPNGVTIVWGARRSASEEWICEPGDSGGVVYQRSGTSGSLIAGLITGGVVNVSTGEPAPVFGYHVCYFQGITGIENQSGYVLA